MASDPLVGKVLADRFAILERIGEGGTGGVYKAKQLSVDGIFAVQGLGAGVSADPSLVKSVHNERRAASVFGTPSYMSPEQGRGVPLDRRSDVYAVGIVLYEMLSGKPPFDGKIPTEVVMMHLRDKPAPLQNVPPQVAQIVMKALDKD